MKNKLVEIKDSGYIGIIKAVEFGKVYVLIGGVGLQVHDLSNVELIRR